MSSGGCASVPREGILHCLWFYLTHSGISCLCEGCGILMWQQLALSFGFSHLLAQCLLLGTIASPCHSIVVLLSVGCCILVGWRMSGSRWECPEVSPAPAMLPSLSLLLSCSFPHCHHAFIPIELLSPLPACSSPCHSPLHGMATTAASTAPQEPTHHRTKES